MTLLPNLKKDLMRLVSFTLLFWEFLINNLVTDLESNAARDRYARLCTVVKSMIGSLKTTQSDDILADVSEELVSILKNIK